MGDQSFERGERTRLAELERLSDQLQSQIRQHERLERALRERQGRFRQLVECGTDCFYCFRLVPRRAYEYISAACREISGYTPEAFYADPNLRSKVVHPDDQKRFSLHEERQAYEGEPAIWRWLHKDGLTRWVEARDVVVRDVHGQPVAIEGLVRDVTAKLAPEVVRAAPSVVRRSDLAERVQQAADPIVDPAPRERDRQPGTVPATEARYRRLFEGAAVSLWEEDFTALREEIVRLKARGIRDFRRYCAENPRFITQAIQLVEVVDVNQHTLRLFQATSKRELLSHLDRTFVPGSEQAFVEAIVAIAEDQEGFQIERVGRTLTGERVHVLVSGRLAGAEAGAQTAMVSMVDLTEQKLRKLLLERSLSAQEEERRRIARELHDEAGQSLASIIVGLQELQQLDFSRRAGRERAARLQEVAENTVDEIGRLARGLHPYLLEDLGLSEALHRYIAELGRISDLRIDLEVVGISASMELPRGVAMALYRIVQEGLTNVVRHARARHVSVVLRWGRQRVKLVVEDDGCGFDRRALNASTSAVGGGQLPGLGLQGIRERVTLLGGSLTIDSTPGEGTTLVVRVPL